MNQEFEERRTQFNKAKNEYEKLRDKERKRLSRYMSDKGLKVVKGSRAGRGGIYSSRGRLVPPFNLANWKWVEIETDNETVIFSLNPYDIDPGSGNIHVLYDRIGIYITSKEKSLLYSTKTIITEYELPLSQEDSEKLYNLIRHNITTYSPPDILDRAIVFATEAHRGAIRKGTSIPYILHPLEAAAIAATITCDYEVLAAAVLHDVIEDTAVTEAV